MAKIKVKIDKENEDWLPSKHKKDKGKKPEHGKKKDAMTVAERIAGRFQLQLAALAALDEGLDVDMFTVLAYGGFTMQREHYLPPEAKDQKPLEPEGTDLQIWTWEGDVRGAKRPYGIAFAGKANKPLWHYAFGSEGSRSEEIKKTIEHRKQYLESKAKQKEDKANFQHGLEPGAILVCSWGYDQTQADFYQVTDVKGKNVVIRELAKKRVGDSSVTAIPNQFDGPPMTKRPGGSAGHPSVRVNSFSSAHLWDGKPEYETPAGMGH